MKRFTMQALTVSLLLTGSLFFSQSLHAQSQKVTQSEKWDNTKAATWSADFKVVDIPSKADSHKNSIGPVRTGNTAAPCRAETRHRVKDRHPLHPAGRKGS